MQSLIRIFEIILLVLFIEDSFEGSNHKHFTTQILEELPRKTMIIDLGKLANKWFPNDVNKNQDSEKPSYKFQFFNCEKASLYFDIDPQTGIITLEKRIDRDSMCHIVSTCCPKKNNQCHLDLTIKSDDDFSHIIVLVIDVKDINDNAPFWIQSELLTKFSEGSEVGDSKSLTVAMDNDVSINGVSHYHLSPETKDFELSYIVNANALMYSNKEQLNLVLKQKLDREKIEKYEFLLTAFDGGNPSFNGSVKLIITVTDENDNSPVFEKNSYLITVNENLPPNTAIIQVKATDADSGMNGKVEYQMSSLTKPEYARLFMIEQKTGYIRVRWELDYETYITISLVIEANDMGNLHRGTTCSVVINIRDLNDNSPEIYFEPSRFTDNAKIIENEVPGKLVSVFSVQDKDSNENGKVTCHLDPIDNKEFTLDRMSIPLTVMYKISTIKSFDRETKSKITAKIVCFDEGYPRRTTSDSVTVGVEDVNDEVPYFSEQLYTFFINEDVKPGTHLFSINATDKDEGVNSLLVYSILGKDENKFSINKLDGKIILEKELDRETLSSLYFRVKVEDSGYPKQIATVNVTVIVKDVNDNFPSLPKVIYLNVKENHNNAFPIVHINATDADEGLNSKIKIILISESAKTVVKSKEVYPFQKMYNDVVKSASESMFLMLSDGKLLIRESGLDRETAIKYNLAIEAFDQGTPPKSTKSTIKINVEDVNDNKPKFIYPSGSNNTIKIKNRIVSGSTIAQIIAVDEDEGQNARLNYSFRANGQANDLFLMQPESGKITLKQTISETHKIYNYHIIVVVKDNGIPHLEDTATLHIIIEPINTDTQTQNKDKKYDEESSEFNNEDNGNYEPKFHNNVVVIIVLISAAALFILMMSLATALLVCRKFKRNRQYSPRERFQFKQNLRNWTFNVTKPFINKRQQIFIQDSNQIEPITGQSLIQNNVYVDDPIQGALTNKSNQSYFLNPLTLEYLANSSNEENQAKNRGEFKNEIQISGVRTYFNFNRSLEVDMDRKRFNPAEDTSSFNPTKHMCDLYEITHPEKHSYTPQFLSGSNV